MKSLIMQLSAVMLMSVLVTSVGATPAFADWDKTNYPAIKGSIPVDKSSNFNKNCEYWCSKNHGEL